MIALPLQKYNKLKDIVIKCKYVNCICKGTLQQKFLLYSCLNNLNDMINQKIKAYGIRHGVKLRKRESLSAVSKTVHKILQKETKQKF